jgi:bla regulator protein BlaR1
MNSFQFLFSPEAQALGQSLLYSLLQSFIIFLCVWTVLKLMPTVSSRIKYALGYSAYMAVAASFIITFIYKLSVLPVTAAAEISQNNPQPLVFHPVTSQLFSFSYLNHYLPFLTAGYLFGIICFAFRLWFNYLQTNKLKRKWLSPLSNDLQQHFFELLKKIKVDQKVNVYFSSKVCSPIMIGFVKPVILLPFSIVNHLSPQQFEAILLHELAHIRRSDFFWNLIQSIADAILFFNPFAIWISKTIREEREKCCDEMVLQSSDRYHYANALLALRQPLQNQPLVLSSVGKHRQLLNRIKYIIEMKQSQIHFSQKFLAFFVILIATFSVAWLTPKEEKPEFVKKHNLSSPNLFQQVFNSTFWQMRSLADSNPLMTAPLPQTIVHSSVSGKAPLPPLPPPPPVAASTPTPPVPPTPPAPPVPPLPPLAPLQMKDSVPPGTSYFDSKEWKQQQEAIRKSAGSMKKYFQSKEWKDQQELIKKNGLAMKKYFNSAEWKKEQKEIQKNGQQIQKYFNGPEWKRQEEEIQKNANHIQKYFNSPEWKKQEEEIQKSGEDMQRYFNSPAWKKQQEEIQKSTEHMQQYFNSPEWKKQQELIQHSSDSVVAYFNSDRWKQQQENLQKLMKQTNKFFQSDEWKNQQEQLKNMMEENKDAMKALKNKANKQKDNSEKNKQ